MNIKLLLFLVIKLLKNPTDFYVNVWIKSRYRNVMMCFFISDPVYYYQIWTNEKPEKNKEKID